MAAVLTIAILLACVATSDFNNSLKFTGHVGENVTLELPLTSSRIHSISLKRPGSSLYVFYCRDGHRTDPGDQDPQFTDRVVIISCQPEDNTFHLTLLNVTEEDSGTYRGRVSYEDGQHDSSLNVSITVTVREHQAAPQGAMEVTAVLTAVGIVALIVAVVIMVVICRRKYCSLSSIKVFLSKANCSENHPPEEPVVYTQVPGSEPSVVTV